MVGTYLAIYVNSVHIEHTYRLYKYVIGILIIIT